MYCKLQTLDLSGNELNGTLEALNDTDIPNLSTLLVPDNVIEGNVTDLSSQQNLKTIDISGNRLKGVIEDRIPSNATVDIHENRYFF